MPCIKTPTELMQNDDSRPVIPHSIMKRVIQSIIRKNDSLKISPVAIHALHHAAEEHMINILEHANLAAIHVNRRTVFQKDIRLVSRMLDTQLPPHDDISEPFVMVGSVQPSRSRSASKTPLDGFKPAQLSRSQASKQPSDGVEPAQRSRSRSSCSQPPLKRSRSDNSIISASPSASMQPSDDVRAVQLARSPSIVSIHSSSRSKSSQMSRFRQPADEVGSAQKSHSRSASSPPSDNDKQRSHSTISLHSSSRSKSAQMSRSRQPSDEVGSAMWEAASGKKRGQRDVCPHISPTSLASSVSTVSSKSEVVASTYPSLLANCVSCIQWEPMKVIIHARVQFAQIELLSDAFDHVQPHKERLHSVWGVPTEFVYDLADLKKLMKDGSFIDTRILQTYLSMLCKSSPTATKPVFLLDSLLFADTLTPNTLTSILNANAIRFAAAAIKPGTEPLFLIPYNTGNVHWILIAIKLRQPPYLPIIYIMDSLCYRSNDIIVNKMLDIFYQFLMFAPYTGRQKTPIPSAWTNAQVPSRQDMGTWTIRQLKVTKQLPGSNSCGAHVCLNARMIVDSNMANAITDLKELDAMHIASLPIGSIQTMVRIWVAAQLMCQRVFIL